MTNEVQLLKQATYSQGHLWFRSAVDEQLYGLALKQARVIVKQIKSLLRLAKAGAPIEILLAQPNQDEKMTIVSAEWLEQMKPLIERALHIIDHRPHTDDFTVASDGPDDVSEVAVDPKSLPQD